MKVEELKYLGFTIKIETDEDAGDPRKEFDQLGEMLCFHREYNLGDKHSYTIEEVRELAESEDWLCLPLYLIDHSGLSMRTHDFRDCDPGGWDSGQVGYIGISYSKAREEFGSELSNAELWERVSNVLRAEVAVYDSYLRGAVYGYTVEDSDGETVGSCWGFYCPEREDYDYMIEEAKGEAEWEYKSRIKSHCDKVKAWIRNRVPLGVRESCPVFV